MDKYKEIKIILDTGEIPIDRQRAGFCDILKNKFNLNIKYMYEEQGANIDILELYITEYKKEFLETIIKTRGLFNVSDMEMVSQDYFPKTYEFLSDAEKKRLAKGERKPIVSQFAVDLAREIVHEYYAYTQKTQDLLMIVKFIPFDRAMLDYIYARSLEHLRRRLSKSPDFPKFYITSKEMFGVTVSVILTHSSYLLTNEKPELFSKFKHECFLITKEQDKLGILNESNYSIKFYDKTTATPSIVGVDPRDWRYKS